MLVLVNEFIFQKIVLNTALIHCPGPTHPRHHLFFYELNCCLISLTVFKSQK